MKWDKDIMFAVLGKGLAFSFNFYELLCDKDKTEELEEGEEKQEDFKVSVVFNTFGRVDFELMKLYSNMEGSAIRNDRKELESFLSLIDVIDVFKVNDYEIDLELLDITKKQHYLTIIFTSLVKLALPDLKKK